MTLKMLEKAPKGLFAAGVAGAPVTKWELYDTAYTERYLGNPSIDPKPYRTSDALDDAVKIERAVAAAPRHVGRQCRLPELHRALRDELQQADRPFEMMFYPRPDTPCIAGEGRQAHVQKTIERFLDEKVLRKAD